MNFTLPISLFDLILVLLVFGFIFFGFWTGLIHALGGLIGVIAGAAIASRVFIPLSNQYASFFGGNENLAKVVTFMVVFVVVNRLVGLIFWILEKVFKGLSVLPFIKTLNRLGGAILGLIEGILVVGACLYVASRYPINDQFTQALQSSNFAKQITQYSTILTPLLPLILKQLRSVIGI